MANKDLRMTAVFSVRDQLSPVMQKISNSWKNLKTTLDSEPFKKLNYQFNKVKYALGDVTKQVQSAAGKIALPLTAAAAAVGFQLSSMVSKFLSVGDSIDKASIRLGVPVEKLQNLRYAAQMSGGTVEIMDKSLAKLNENLAKAAAGKNEDLANLMKKLGISLKDANGQLRTAADVLPEFADGIQRNKDAGLRARMAIAAFGEEGQKLIPMLEGGSAALSEMEKRANELGLSMSQQDVKAAADLGDRFSELGMVFDAFGNTLSAKVAPILSPLINDLTEFIGKNKEAFSERVRQAVESFSKALRMIDFKDLADKVSSALSVIGKFFDKIGGFETVLKIIAGLFAAQLITGIAGFVSSLMTLGTAFATLIPLIKSVGALLTVGMGPLGLILAGIAAAAGLIIANWDTVGPYFEALGQKIQAIWNATVESVMSYFSDLIDNIKNLWTAVTEGDFPAIANSLKTLFLQPFTTLYESMGEVGSKLVSAAGNIVSDIGRKFAEFFSSLNLSDMLPDSFKNGLNWISDKLGLSGNSGSSGVMAPAYATPGASGGAASSVYNGMPVNNEARVDGTIKVEVTAANGAEATVTETAMSNSDIRVQGNPGSSERFSGD